MTAGVHARPGTGRGSGPGLLFLLAVPLGAGLVLALPGAAAGLELVRGGTLLEPWRLLGGHLAHYTVAHWALDALAFVVLGASCARVDLRRTWAAVAAAAVAVPAAVLAFAPAIERYRGLSGLDSALFGLLVALRLRERRDPVLLLAAAAFLGKLAFELVTARSFFLGAPAFVPVPVAHVAGALCGILVGTLGSARAWRTSPVLRRAPPPRSASSASSR